jgi:hypothetical protein
MLRTSLGYIWQSAKICTTELSKMEIISIEKVRYWRIAGCLGGVCSAQRLFDSKERDDRERTRHRMCG